MGFIKKKMFLILCIAVSLLGIGIFVNGMMVSAENQDHLGTITETIQKVDGFRSQAIPEDEVGQLQAQAEGHQRNMKQVESWMAETTRRAVLFRAVFPQLNHIGDNEIRFREFAKRYCTFVESLLDRLGAGTCPSIQEEAQTIKTFLEHLQDSDALEIDQEEQVDRICNELYRKRAGECVVYADTGVFCAYGHWKGKPRLATPMYQDAWYTQLASWIQEDVVDAIVEINGPSQSVLTSPVKRILEISFSGEVPEGVPTENTTVATTSRSSSSRKDRGQCASRLDENSVNRLPAYITSSEQKSSGYSMASRTSTMSGGSSYQGGLAAPFTKNACNDLIDVVHFEVGLVIDSTRITDFIRVLESQKQSQVILLHNGPKTKTEILDLARIQTIRSALQSSSDGMVSVEGRQILASEIELKQIRRNQITVLQMDIMPIDLSVEQKSGYYYGSGCFKVLRLTCEYIFFKNGYNDLMPKPVHEVLNPGETAQPTRPGRW